jgi:hypothetical protein
MRAGLSLGGGVSGEETKMPRAIMLWVLWMGLLWALPVHAITRNVSDATQLQSAMTAAVAGDEIVLANGTYQRSANFTTGNAGTSGNRIVMRAANQHLAILQGTENCTGQAPVLSVPDAWWEFKDLVIRNSQRAVDITGTNVWLHDNLIYNYHEDGVRLFSTADDALIERNVIGYSDSCRTRDDGAINAFEVDRATIRDNIIVSTGTNAYTPGSSNLYGYGILIGATAGQSVRSTGHLIQGNLLLFNGGKGGTRLYDTRTSTFRDNAVLWSAGYGSDSSDCSDDTNQFLNNILYEDYYQSAGAKGQTYVPGAGHHTWDHNLIVADGFTRYGLATSGGGDTDGAGTLCAAGTKTNLTVRNNLFYAPTSTLTQDHRFWLLGSMSQLTLANNNLFWASTGTAASWVVGYTYQSQDIRTPGAGGQPLFVNAAQGDFSLQAGSPGENAATDGTDIGISYNTFLKQAWLANAFGLQTYLSGDTSAQTSTSFTVVPGSSYDVWFYVPESPGACGTAQQFTVEGVGGTLLQRNITLLHNGGNSTWIAIGGPTGTNQRWTNLGRHAVSADGVLNIGWQTAGCASKVHARRIPTVTEAYQWILSGQQPPLSAPPVVAIDQPTAQAQWYTTGTTVALVSGPATDDVGVPSVTWACPQCTPTSGTASCNPACGASTTSTTWSIADLGLAVGQNVLTVSTTDADDQTTSDQLIAYVADTSSNLTLWFDYEGPVGHPTTTDQAGDNDGTLTGDAVFQTGEHGDYALHVGGAGSVSVPGLLGSNSIVSISTWFKIESLDSTGGGLVSLGDSVGVAVVAGTPTVLRGFYHDGTSQRNLDYTVALGTGWHHAVYTVAAGSQHLYLDGAEVGIPGTQAGAPNYAGRGANTIIGAHGNGGTTWDFVGKIDETRIYTGRALNIGDIQQIHAYTTPPVSRAIAVGQGLTGVHHAR